MTLELPLHLNRYYFQSLVPEMMSHINQAAKDWNRLFSKAKALTENLIFAGFLYMQIRKLFIQFRIIKYLAIYTKGITPAR